MRALIEIDWGQPTLKVLHFSVQDISDSGGGVRVTYNLHRALRQAGHESRMVVARKLGDDPDVFEAGNSNIGCRAQMGLNSVVRHIIRRYCDIKTAYIPDFLGISSSAYLTLMQSADIIHLHWVAGFLTSQQIRAMNLKTRLPIVWTLMDIAPLTGGCHYAYGCQGYTKVCGRCPQIHSDFIYDLSWWSWRRKRNNLGGLPTTLVAGTQWLVDRTRESSLFMNRPIAKIPIGIDSEIFCPRDARLARELLRLPQDKKIIFFGAAAQSDERKGMRYLVEALGYLAAQLQERSQEIIVVMAGRQQFKNDLPFACYQLGYLRDDVTLALAYQAADVFVCPSIEDAGPMMIPEAMMCGTPVVAFNAGGAPDLIETQKTGYLATYKDSADLANGVYVILTTSDLSAKRVATREAAVRLHISSVVTAQYIDLYRSLVKP